MGRPYIRLRELPGGRSEGKVIAGELTRETTIGWYRNPARASQDSLGVTYEDGGEVKILRPDFIFFVRLPDGSIAADIVDPHGIQFGDALPKLKGLAKYAEENLGIYRRIEVFAKVGGRERVIDLTDVSARIMVMAAKSIKEVYESDSASDYS